VYICKVGLFVCIGYNSRLTPETTALKFLRYTEVTIMLYVSQYITTWAVYKIT